MADLYFASYNVVDIIRRVRRLGSRTVVCLRMNSSMSKNEDTDGKSKTFTISKTGTLPTLERLLGEMAALEEQSLQLQVYCQRAFYAILAENGQIWRFFGTSFGIMHQIKFICSLQLLQQFIQGIS